MIYAVPAEAVRAIWPKIDKAMEKSLEVAETHDAEDVVKLCEQQKCWLYVQTSDEHGINAAAVLDVVQYPKGKECRAWLVGSVNKPDWKEFTEYLIMASKANGCRWFSGGGRTGWNRFVKGKLYSGIRKELEQ